MPRCTSDLDIWVDVSSSWGIGLVVEKSWSTWRLLPGWDQEDRDIGWAESVALELAVIWLVEQGFADCDVTVRGDNTGVIGAFNKGHSRNALRNATVCRIASCLVPFNISVVPVYVASSENRADPVSRGVLGPQHLRLGSAFELPSELLPFLLMSDNFTDMHVQPRTARSDGVVPRVIPSLPPSDSCLKCPRLPSNPQHHISVNPLRP